MYTLRIPALIVLSLSVVACSSIDTTGISPQSSKTPRGPEVSAVTLTEFGDLQCPACKAAHTLLTKPLLEKYGKKIRFEYVQFPLQSIHAYAYKAAQASECAADQGKFWEYVDLNYEKQDELPSDPHEKWAESLGLNADLFHRCLASGIKSSAIDADIAKGDALKVNSTPSYFVNGVRVETNTIEDLSKAIESALQKSATTPL